MQADAKSGCGKEFETTLPFASFSFGRSFWGKKEDEMDLQDLEKLLRSGGTGPFNPNPRQLAESAGSIHGFLLGRYIEIRKTADENKKRVSDKAEFRKYLDELLGKLAHATPLGTSDKTALNDMVEAVTGDERPAVIAQELAAVHERLKRDQAASLVAIAIVGIAADAIRRASTGPDGQIVVAMGVGRADIIAGIWGALHGAAGGPAMAIAIGLIEAPIGSLIEAIGG
jgi:hypothetical protein